MSDFFNSGGIWINVQIVLALLSIQGNFCLSHSVNGKLMPFIDQKSDLNLMAQCYENSMTISNWNTVGATIGPLLASFGDPSRLEVIILNSNLTDDSYIMHTVASSYYFALKRKFLTGTKAAAKLRQAGIRLNLSSANQLKQEALMVEWDSKDISSPAMKSVIITMSTEIGETNIDRVPLLLAYNNNYFRGGFFLGDTVIIIHSNSGVNVNELIEFKQSSERHDLHNVVVAVRIQPQGVDCSEPKLQILSVPGVIEVYVAEIDRTY